MKKNTLLLIVFIALGLVTFWIIYSQNNSTIKQELKDFAVSDTSGITRIVIASKNGKTADLERKGPGHWMINGKFIARNDALNNLMEAICKVQVRNPVGKRAVENVTKGLATGGSKVDIYVKGELFKVYYIGGETSDQEGTYMLMHDHEEGVNASAPFVVHIPGFVGYLSPRYFTDEKLWREKSLFRFTANSLQKVEIEYFRFPDSSFTVTLAGGSKIQVFNKKGLELQLPDTLKTRQYLSYFSSVNYEGIELFGKEKRDSILGTPPIHRITATDITGQSTTLTTYSKPPVQKGDDLIIAGKVLTEDPDRMWAVINNNKEEVVLVQFYVIGKLLQSPGYFKYRTSPVKK